MIAEVNAEGLAGYIYQIINQLSIAEIALAADAERNSLLSASEKVVLIFLGAFVATKEVASQLFGASNVASMVIYTLAGVLVSVIAGLDAAFKWAQSSADLKSLAASCQISRIDAQSALQKALAIKGDDDRQAALEKLVDTLTKSLEDIYGKATALGINIVLEITVPGQSSSAGGNQKGL